MSTTQPKVKRSDLLKEIEKLRERVQELENAAARSGNEGAIPQGQGAERYRQMVEFVPDAVSIFLDERFVFINTHGVKMIGAKTADELLGRNIWDFCHPNYWDLGKSRYSQCINGNDYLPPAEFELIRLNGEVITVESSARPITYDRRRAILAVWRDISHRKQAEDTLRKSDDRLRMLVESAPMGIFTTISSGKVIAINIAMARILGFPSPEEALEHFTDLSAQLYVHAERRDEFIRLLRSFGRVEQFEYQARTAAGSIIWLSMNARVSERREDGSFIIEGFATDITERKHAEEALKERENLLQKVFDILPIGLWFTDKKGTLLRGNPMGVRIWGAEELVNPAEYGVFKARRIPTMEEIAPDDWALSRSIREGATIVDELLEIDTFDGKKKTILNYTAPVIDEQGVLQGAIVVNQDITERKRAEEALRESEAIFSLFMEHCPVYVFFKDETTRPIRLSRNYEQLLGRPINDLLGKTMNELFPSELAKGMIEDDLSVIRGGKPIKVVEELNGRTFETTKFPILQPGKQNWLAGFTIDITERKRAEAAVRESEARYRTLVENIPQAVVLKDRESNYISINTAYVNAFGLRHEQVIGKSDYDLYPKHLAEKFRKEDRLVMETGESMEFEEEIGVDAQKRFYHKVKVPVRDSAGKIIGVQSTLSDITDRLRMEEHLRHSQKTEAIGALAGGIAHDFNNILSAIIGYTELAMLNEGAEHCAAELKEALIAANRAKDLVKQILAFSRQTDEERMPVKVGLVAKEAVKFLRATIPATIEIKTRIDEKSGTVLANSVELHQIIMNLCTNAQHAIGEHAGVLVVEVQNTEIDLAQKDDFIDLEIGSYVRVSVKDTGLGMAPNVMKRIFDPYFTTKEKGVGTGLGLAVVHGIVKKYGGTIKVESALGRGSAFHIYLPKADIAAPIQAEQPKSMIGGSERILFVDDEKMLVAVGQQVLQHLGYDVVSRTSPMEALELFKAKPDHFDLVITDQTMPGMTGEALARELLRIRPTLPIIICTGYSQTIDQERAVKIGIKAFVMKPILINEIAGAVRKVLDEVFPANGDPGAESKGRAEASKK